VSCTEQDSRDPLFIEAIPKDLKNAIDTGKILFEF